MKLFGNKKHPVEDQVLFLSEKEQFLDFLDWIQAGREIAISNLSRATDGRIREISGKIQAYDEILTLCNYHDLLIKRAARKMNGYPV